jgi:hypothetical protein
MAALLAGCVSIKDRSEKYHAFIGKQFVTRYECVLWKMKRHNFDIVPFTLKPVGSAVPFGTKIASIPAGTVITVRDAKVSFVGGDWDFILAELHLPGTAEPILFEEMIGFSSVDPNEILKRWSPLQ